MYKSIISLIACSWTLLPAAALTDYISGLDWPAIGIITAPFVFDSRRDVNVPSGSKENLDPLGSVELTIACATATSVRFQMYVRATNGGSVYISVDDGAPLTWNTGRLTGNGGWSSHSPSLSFSAGNHQLWIRDRQDDISIVSLMFETVYTNGCQFQRPHQPVTSISAIIGTVTAPFVKMPEGYSVYPTTLAEYVELPEGTGVTGASHGI